MIWLCLSFLLILGGVCVYRERCSHRLVAQLLKRMDELQSDNRSLTEALTRKEGGPVIFKPREPIVSPGWFDGKKRIVAGEKP